jgi:hypothetical protein
MNTATRYRPLTAILVGGGIAAVLDIVYAILRNGGYGKSPLWVLQSVASGWTGNGAFESGVAGGAIGLISHFAILFIAAALYWIASRRFPVLRTQWLLCGTVFGIAVYCFMNFAVLPLSAFPFNPKYPALKLLEGFASHAVFVGLPIGWAAKRWS